MIKNFSSRFLKVVFVEQLELTPASLRAAIEDEIRDAGGWFAVAAALYPQKFKESPDAAERHLRNSVDPSHSQKLCVYQHQVIKALAKKTKGRVASIVYDCQEHDYTVPSPITPEDRLAQEKRVFVETAQALLAAVPELLKRLNA